MKRRKNTQQQLYLLNFIQFETAAAESVSRDILGSRQNFHILVASQIQIVPLLVEESLPIILLDDTVGLGVVDATYHEPVTRGCFVDGRAFSVDRG